MDKDGDQIIHEEQATRDQEQKEDKLPSKQARRLPTTRHDDFLWLDINMNQFIYLFVLHSIDLQG